MAFDLNKIPPVEEEMDVVEVTTESLLNGTLGCRTGAEDAPLIGPWQTLSPTELASLYNMVQVPANYHRVHRVITHRANGTSEHAWISWLPPHHTFPGGTVLQPSEWRTMPSIFHAIPVPLGSEHTRRPPPGRAAPDQDVTSAFFDPRTLCQNSHGGHQQADIGSSQHVEEAELDELVDHQVELPKEEGREMREAAFLAEFNYSTQRCSPTVPCSRCLKFFRAPLPVNLAARSTGSSMGALYACPPVLKNMDEEEAALRKGARHGPRSKCSVYRGVTYYKRTGRWESHIWHEGAQVYLGASETKEEAAKVYDKAAIMLGGTDADINFKPESYQHEMNYLYKLSKEQLVIYLRRDSRGFGAQAAYPGVKRVKNNSYQAVFGATLLGTFSTEEEAARVVYKAAVQKSCGTMASVIIDTHHVRKMPSFAAQRHAAVYPEEMEAMMLKIQTKASKKGGNASPSTKKCSAPSTSQKPSFESSPVTPSATASPDPAEQLPAIQIDDNGSPGAKRNRSTWGQHGLASKRAHKQTCPTKDAAARNPPATSIVPPASSSRPGSCNTTSPGVGVSRIPPSSATVLSAFSAIGHTSTPSSVAACSVSSPSWKERPMTSGTISAPAGPTKFKLFNVEINVAEEKAAREHGGHDNLNEVEAGDHLYTPPLMTEENQFDKLIPKRERPQENGARIIRTLWQRRWLRA